MKLAEEMAKQKEKTRARVFSSLTEFVERDRTPRITPPSWHEPVQQAVNRADVDRLAQERQSPWRKNGACTQQPPEGEP